MSTIEISILKTVKPFIKNIDTVISHFEWYLAKNKKISPFFQEKKSFKDMLDMLKRLSIQTEASQLRKILQDNWKLEPHPSTYYTVYLFGYNDEILFSPKTARLYRITQKQVEEIMSEC
ncbi:hypothetical protein EZS27_027731 [termite gut metagenome]|uniref:Uncharacterized protein n=1 Tax=termite gut metagenome TaxID=433724 RepID=A0A5J4QLD9_9ZZZZ